MRKHSGNRKSGTAKHTRKPSVASTNPAEREPAWLREACARAFRSFQRTGFPTTRDEDWRFTSVAAIAQTNFSSSRNGHRLPTRRQIGMRIGWPARLANWYSSMDDLLVRFRVGCCRERRARREPGRCNRQRAASTRTLSGPLSRYRSAIRLRAQRRISRRRSFRAHCQGVRARRANPSAVRFHGARRAADEPSAQPDRRGRQAAKPPVVEEYVSLGGGRPSATPPPSLSRETTR